VKAYIVFDVDARLADDIEEFSHAAGTIGDCGRHHFAHVHHVAGVFQDFLGFLPLFDDQPNDAELLCVGEGEGHNVDVGFGQRAADGVEVPGLFSRKSEI
jgi:hypothetical protein